MRLSTSTNITAFLRETGQKNSFDFCIELCARAGYKVLDINLCEAMNPQSRMRTDDWQNFVKDIAELGRRWGVEFAQSHLPYYNVFSPQPPEKIKLMEELIRRCIIASAELGVKWAVAHPVSPCEKNLSYYSVHLETAKKAGVGIALENDYGFDIPGLCQLADAFNDPLIGICYDFGHANLNGGFHRENLRTIGKRLKATHVQDNFFTADDHLMPFFGKTDWADAMTALAEIGYEGDLTFEIQEFGRYLPNELKHLVVELSVKIGNYLIELYEKEIRD